MDRRGPFALAVTLALSTIGCSGGMISGDNSASEREPEPSPSERPDELRGPCLVTVGLASGDEVWHYNVDGLEVLWQRPGGNHLIAWNSDGNESTETTSLGSVNTRHYQKTPSGLRIETYSGRSPNSATISETTEFELDGEGNLWGSIFTSSARTEEHTITSSDGAIQSSIRLEANGFEATTNYFYENGVIVRLEFNTDEDPGLESRTHFIRDDAQRLIESRYETINDSNQVVGTEVRGYSYEGRCDSVEERWYFRGSPYLEM